MERLLIKNRRGFTIVEMLMALTIFSIGMLAVINMFVVSFAASRSVRALNTATRLSQTAMETMMVNPKNTAAGFTSLINAALTEGGSVVSATNPVKVKWPDPTNIQFPYTITVDITSIEVVSGVSLSQAEVKVEWMDRETPKLLNVISYLP